MKETYVQLTYYHSEICSISIKTKNELEQHLKNYKLRINEVMEIIQKIKEVDEKIKYHNDKAFEYLIKTLQ